MVLIIRKFGSKTIKTVRFTLKVPKNWYQSEDFWKLHSFFATFFYDVNFETDLEVNHKSFNKFMTRTRAKMVILNLT
jgi:hypothetical protein